MKKSILILAIGLCLATLPSVAVTNKGPSSETVSKSNCELNFTSVQFKNPIIYSAQEFTNVEVIALINTDATITYVVNEPVVIYNHVAPISRKWISCIKQCNRYNSALNPYHKPISSPIEHIDPGLI